MTDELEVLIVDTPDIVAVPDVQIDVLTETASAPVVIESPDVEVVTIEEDVHVVDTVAEINIVSVGEVGPPGPPGSPGEFIISKTASATLSGHRAVVPDAVGGVIYADSSTLTHRDKTLGITTGAAGIGAAASIRTYGELNEPSWNWALDTPVFVGLTGLLTQTPPTSGFVQRVGFPTATDTLFVDIDTAITL